MVQKCITNKRNIFPHVKIFQPKPTYEVTEKYSDQPVYQANPKIEAPVGFSKASVSVQTQETRYLVTVILSF